MTEPKGFTSPSGGAKVPGTPGLSQMPNWYPELLESVAQQMMAGRHRALVAAGQELVATYWRIGRAILDRQGEEGWGTKVIDRLAVDLSHRFPDARGYSARNLRYMRAFAAAWPHEAILQAPLAQLPWYHHVALMEKLSAPDLRRWYAERALVEGWSRNILVLQIESRLHERVGKAVTNFAGTLPPPDSDLAQQMTKDPYLLDFVGAAAEGHERVLERALVDHVERFLLELGQGFAFVGRQKRLVVGGEDLYVDLLFYHFVLHCFVVVELKTVKFDPGFLGQLGTYMAVIDDTMRQPEDKPTIGLLLCRTRNDQLAEYALSSMKGPIGVADWVSALQTTLPAELAANLPSIAELEAELAVTVTTTVEVEVTPATDPTEGATVEDPT